MSKAIGLIICKFLILFSSSLLAVDASDEPFKSCRMSFQSNQPTVGSIESSLHFFELIDVVGRKPEPSLDLLEVQLEVFRIILSASFRQENNRIANHHHFAIGMVSSLDTLINYMHEPSSAPEDKIKGWIRFSDSYAGFLKSMNKR